MRNLIHKAVILTLLMVSFSFTFAQQVTVIAPSSEAAKGLDLNAVAELFKDSENLEEFEKALNDPESGINNLDLDENDKVDFIRVVEETEDDVHVIILQAALGKDEFQDVATIETEKGDQDDTYNMQVRGNEDIYGANYYVAPTVVHIHAWPIIRWIYRPVYRPYRSVWVYGHYPRWWRPYRPLTVKVYHKRTVHFTKRATFSITRKPRVTKVTRVNYKPRRSTVVKKTTVRKGNKKVTKTTRVKKTKNGRKKTTTVRKTKVRK